MNYREEMLRTAKGAGDPCLGAMGLAGETGEVVDAIKKIVFHGKKYDRDEMLKELGDVRWYLEYLAHCFGFTMEQIEQANVEKLRKRYPAGFVKHEEAVRE